MNRYTLLLFDFFKGRKTFYYLREFSKLQSLHRGQVRMHQFAKLRALLFHAEKNVPFYQKRFRDIGFSARNFDSVDQLSEIPPLTRQDLQDNWQDIVALNYDLNALSKGSSSGSSGLPVFYFKDSNASSAGQAAHLLGWSLSGWDMRMKGLHIWGNPSTVHNEWKRPSSRLKAWLFGHHKFPAYTLVDGQNFRVLYELIQKNRYEYLDGYTNAIYLFADFLQRNNLTLKNTVKYVLTTAENLQDFQRQTIQKTIAPVFDTYGCSEINGIAYECWQCGHYHVIDPHVYLEFGEPADEQGARELMVTDLDNYAFPLIRYKNDDLGIPLPENENECPVPFSRIAGVSGRQSDIIRLRDGGTLSVPSFFGSMLLKQINGLKQYQVERRREDFIVVNLVKTQDFTPDDETILESALHEYLNGRMRYEIRYTEKIEPSSTGKLKLLIDRTKE